MSHQGFKENTQTKAVIIIIIIIIIIKIHPDHEKLHSQHE